MYRRICGPVFQNNTWSIDGITELRPDSRREMFDQVRIAKLPDGVELSLQLLEIREPWIELSQATGGRRKQLRPVRPRVERGELRFDQRQYLSNTLPLRLPCKVDRKRVALVRRAHPQIVRGNSPQLADKQMRRNAIA